MKQIIFIGNIASGKTTLSQAILGKDIFYKKTQSVEVLGSKILDTPGEFLERSQMRGALMTTSADAEVIGFVQAAIDEINMFPPFYAGSFSKEVIGIVTKIDIATKLQIKEAENILKNAGVKKIFYVSSYTKEGIMELIEYLN